MIMITTITKRDGRTVHFDINKIASAIEKAFAATIGKKDYAICLALAQEVSDIFEEKQIDSPTVEQIQDTVERVLINHGHVRTAKAYILYRAERTRDYFFSFLLFFSSPVHSWRFSPANSSACCTNC